MANSKYPSNSFPVERLWALYDYNPLTGYLISKSKVKAGQPVIGCLNNGKRAWMIHLCREDRSQVLTNYGRCVFAWCHGRWPEGEIDHKDRNPRNNRPWNLREADRVLQAQNRSCYNYGAYWNKREKKWKSQIRINGKTKGLGYYSTEIEAQKAFIRACDQIGHPYLEPVLVDGKYIAAERLQ